MLKHLAVLFSTLLLDIVWTLTVQEVGAGRAVQAGVYSALTILLSAFNTISIVENKRLIAPAVLGGFAGTWLTVRFLG